MKIHTIPTGTFKLDGGAMFGVVPKPLWEKVNTPDEKNLCTWAMRCMLVEFDDRKILIDTGIGHKQTEKFFGYYEPSWEPELVHSLSQNGFKPEDITDVFHTHLHFDHCGGAFQYDSDNQLTPVFPNATYWCNKSHWEWATKPNPREKASFLKENILPMQESGKLELVDEEQMVELFPGFRILFAYGHTEAQMIPHIEYKGKTVVFMADLLPSVGHIPLAWVMAYDTKPLQTMKEKAAFLNEAAEKEYVLFLEHDHQNECCTLHHTDKGVRLKETFSFNEAFPG